MDIHARVQEFLQQHDFPQGEGNYVKAGVVPFLQGPYRYYLMKPVARDLSRDAPRFQLCKGTRMKKVDGVWVDMPSSFFPSPLVGEGGAKRREREYLKDTFGKIPPLPDPPPQGGRELLLESLAATALREGIEELGLRLQNIKQLFDVGLYGFSSATTGKSKEMWLFAAEMKSDDFSTDVAPTTAECAWLTVPEFEIAGREDHRYILRDIERKLKE